MSDREFNTDEPIAYFITWTTYGTWLPGDERGSWHRGQYQSTNKLFHEMAAAEMKERIAALVAGSKLCGRHLNRVIAACHTADSKRLDDADQYDARRNPELKQAVIAARRSAVPEAYVQRVIEFARQGFTEIEFPTFDTDWDSEAYLTVSGQNSNNSVRVTNAFIEAVKSDGDWDLIQRTDGAVAETVKARQLWDDIANAAWACADPGIQYDTTINEWHTCPASGRINASNPCVTGDTLVATCAIR